LCRSTFCGERCDLQHLLLFQSGVAASSFRYVGVCIRAVARSIAHPCAARNVVAGFHMLMVSNGNRIETASYNFGIHVGTRGRLVCKSKQYEMNRNSRDTCVMSVMKEESASHPHAHLYSTNFKPRTSSGMDVQSSNATACERRKGAALASAAPGTTGNRIRMTPR